MDNDEAFVAGLVRLNVPINRIAQSETTARRMGINTDEIKVPVLAQTSRPHPTYRGLRTN